VYTLSLLDEADLISDFNHGRAESLPFWMAITKQ